MSGSSTPPDWPRLKQHISDLVNAGQLEAVEAVLRGHGDLQADESLVLKCIDCEVNSRTSRGQKPQVSEYLRRFPEYGPRLRSLWESQASRQPQGDQRPEAGERDQSANQSPSAKIAVGTLLPEKLDSLPHNSEKVLSSQHLSDFSNLEDQLLQMYREGLLTEFQAEQVSAGRVKSLILGGYTILDRIGSGGMGEVFKAEHRRMARIVAIKTLSPAVTQDAETNARFEREARLAAKLLHKNIVTAFDADQFNGMRFLVMEYVEGEDLAALVQRIGPLPAPVALDYLLQAARGLECAHAEGVIHRDIKPANLLLDKKGVVKILDMGIARIQTPRGAAMRSELTLQGDVFGTVEFMSPEQSFDTKNVDGRTDIYSLGCSLYYLISGQPVFGGDTLVEKIVAHRERPIPSLRTVDGKIPPQIDALFKKMVAKRVQDRFQTITEVVEYLSKFSRGEGLPADQIEAHRHTGFGGPKRRSRNHLFRAVAGLLLVAACVASVLWVMDTRRDPNPPPVNLATNESNPVEMKGSASKEPEVEKINLAQSQEPPLGTVEETLETPDRPNADARLKADTGVADAPHLPEEIPKTPPKEEVTLADNDSEDDNLESPPEQKPEKPVQELPKTDPPAIESTKPEPPMIEPPKTDPPKTESKVAASDKTDIPVPRKDYTAEVAAALSSSTLKADAQPISKKQTALLTAEEQVRLVVKRLRELNPGFDGRETHTIAEGGTLTELQFLSDEVSDISPVSALTSLKTLRCGGSEMKRGKLSNLAALRGVSLTALNVENSQVSDLSPLHDMKLIELNCAGTQVSSLAPLKGMPLHDLRCSRTPVKDLVPLKGMALKRLDCDHTHVTSLLPLLDCKDLRTLTVDLHASLVDLARIQLDLPQCHVERTDHTKHAKSPPPRPQP